MNRLTPLSERPKFRDLVVLKREEGTGRFLTNVPHVVFYHVDFDSAPPQRPKPSSTAVSAIGA